MKAAPAITSLNAGELSPSMEGRFDLAKYQNGCKLSENFLQTIQGPAVRRGGTRFMAEVKNSAHRTHLIKFEFSDTQAFQLEFGDRYVRFFTDHGRLVVSAVTAWSNATAYVKGDLASRLGVNYYCILAHTNQQPPNATYWYPLTGDIYEIPSPYLLADLTNTDGSCALDVEQSGDVLYIANMKGTYKVQKLTRFANTHWQFIDYDPVTGPFADENGTAITLTAAAATGATTVAASADLFVATDVGRLVRLQSQNLDVKPWETAKSYSINDLVRFGGKTYKALTAATSGSSPPVHELGSAFDGQAGVQWEYQNAGYGVLRITAFTDAQNVNATVQVDEGNGLNVLPADVAGSATKRWKLGSFSATSGYPNAVAQWRNRLWLGQVTKLYGSVPEDFENMAGDFFGQTTTDNAIWTQVQSADVNRILWLSGADKLIIGTGGGEHVAGEITTNDPLGPENFKIDPPSRRRARGVRPVIFGSTLLYVQRAGRKLLSLEYRFDIDRYAASDQAALSNRMTRSGIIGMALQNEPYQMIWLWLANGKLLGFTYDKDQDVVNWHRHPLGGSGITESCVVTPAPTGDYDELTLIARRTINGQSKRYVEFKEKEWEGEDQDGTVGDAQEDAFYVDCGLTYDGAPTISITGLDHLEGQTVQVLVDGATHPDKVVTGGAITLERLGSKVHAGLGALARIVKLRLEAGSADGTAQGKTKRITGLTIRFVDTLGGRAGMYRGRLDSISLRSPSTPMGQAPAIVSGDFNLDPFPGDYDRDGLIEIRQDQPLPMTIAAMMPRMKTYD